MKKRSRNAVYEAFPGFPAYSYDEDSDTDLIAYPPVLRTEILEPRGMASREHAFAQMARALTALASLVSTDGFVFMGDSPRAWRYQRNDYPHVKRADEFLAAKRVGRKFTGGLSIGTTELEEWLPHLLWIVTCNAALPTIYFFDAGQQILGYFCQYGNLHLDLLNDASAKAFKQFANDGSFRKITRRGCRPKVSVGLRGRQIIV